MICVESSALPDSGTSCFRVREGKEIPVVDDFDKGTSIAILRPLSDTKKGVSPASLTKCPV